jgi:hypothetical protein
MSKWKRVSPFTWESNRGAEVQLNQDGSLTVFADGHYVTIPEDTARDITQTLVDHNAQRNRQRRLTAGTERAPVVSGPRVSTAGMDAVVQHVRGVVAASMGVAPEEVTLREIPDAHLLPHHLATQPPALHGRGPLFARPMCAQCEKPVADVRQVPLRDGRVALVCWCHGMREHTVVTLAELAGLERYAPAFTGKGASYPDSKAVSLWASPELEPVSGTLKGGSTLEPRKLEAPPGRTASPERPRPIPLSPGSPTSTQSESGTLAEDGSPTTDPSRQRD